MRPVPDSMSQVTLVPLANRRTSKLAPLGEVVLVGGPIVFPRDLSNRGDHPLPPMNVPVGARVGGVTGRVAEGLSGHRSEQLSGHAGGAARLGEPASE